MMWLDDQYTGGDAFITICLWKAGYAMTDPGWSFYHPEFRMFDAGPEDRQGVLMRLSKALDRKCDDTCQVRVQDALQRVCHQPPWCR